MSLVFCSRNQVIFSVSVIELRIISHQSVAGDLDGDLAHATI